MGREGNLSSRTSIIEQSPAGYKENVKLHAIRKFVLEKLRRLVYFLTSTLTIKTIWNVH